MRNTLLGLSLAALVVGASGVANAQARVRAERGLLGINLFDSGAKVLNRFGTPDQIQPISLGGGTQFGGGGGRPGGAPGAPGGFPGAGGGAPAGFPASRPGGGGGAPTADQHNPFGFADEILRQGAAAPPPIKGGRGPNPSGGGSQGGPPSGPPGGYPGGPSGPGGFPGGGRPGGAPGGGIPNAGQGERVTVTRWVYNQRASKYAFIVDRQGRVVQIEAIGLKDARAKTSNGVSFGSTFRTIVLKYGNPDGYEISGDNILVKYLTRRKVAFKLSRLGQKTPQVVTGIVVAAGKG